MAVLFRYAAEVARLSLQVQIRAMVGLESLGVILFLSISRRCDVEPVMLSRVD